MRAILTTR